MIGKVSEIADLSGEATASRPVDGAFTTCRAWSVVLLLTVVGVLNVMDRGLPGILVEPIKHDLMLPDSAIGLINGIGFLVVYAAVGLPLARLADRGAYGAVTAACLVVWSLMTAAASGAQTMWQFAATRMGVAVGEAGYSPAAHAFIGRNFPPEARGAPLAVMTLALPAALFLAPLLGALLGASIGWRMTFLLMGAIGCLVAPFALWTMGPRQAIAPFEATNMAANRSLRRLLGKPSFVLITLAGSCISAGGYTLATFSAAFLMRVHRLSLTDVGLLYGIVSGLSGAAGLIASGLIADRLSRRDPRWGLWVVALMILLVAPFGFAAFLVGGQTAAVILLAIVHIVGVAYFAPLISALQRLARDDERATASALFLFVGALVGGLGPAATGFVSDALRPAFGARGLAYGMMLAPALFVIAMCLLLLAARTYRRDLTD